MHYKNRKKLRKNKLKPLIIMGLIFLVAPTIVLVVNREYQGSKNNEIELINSKTGNVEQKIDLSPIKEEDKLPESEDGKSDPSQSTTNNQTSKSIAITLAAAGQDYPGGPLVVSAIVNGTREGECMLTLSNESKNISKKASIISLGTYYACEEFSVDPSELEVGGRWSIKLDVTSGNNSGTVSQETEVSL